MTSFGKGKLVADRIEAAAASSPPSTSSGPVTRPSAPSTLHRTPSPSPRRRDTSQLPRPKVTMETNSSPERRRISTTMSSSASPHSKARLHTSTGSRDTSGWDGSSSLTSMESTSAAIASSSNPNGTHSSSSSKTRSPRNTSSTKASSRKYERTISFDSLDSSEDEGKLSLADASDSDESFADVTIRKSPNQTKKFANEPSPGSPQAKNPSPHSRHSTSRHALVDDDGDSSCDEVQRPKRSSAMQQGAYIFRPSLHKPSRPSVSSTSAAQQARIVSPVKGGRFTIDALLREKKLKSQRGTDAKGLEALDEKAAKWEEQSVGITNGDKEAMQKLQDAHVARAVEGIDDDEDGEEAAEEDGGEVGPGMLSDDSGDDFNPLHSIWEESITHQGTLEHDHHDRDFERVERQIRHTLATEEGASAEQEALVEILVQDAGQRARTDRMSGSQEGGDHSFWKNGRVATPAANLPLERPCGAVQVAFNQALLHSPRRLAAFLRSQVLVTSQADSRPLLIPLLHLSVFSANLDVAAAALASIRGLLMSPKTGKVDQCALEVVPFFSEALRKMGAASKTLGRSGALDVTELSPSSPKTYGPQDPLPHGQDLLDPVSRGQMVHRFLRITEILFTARHQDASWIEGLGIPTLIGYLLRMGCDPRSYGPATLSHFQSVIEVGLASLPWSSYSAWGNLLDATFPAAESSEVRHSSVLQCLRVFPNASTRARILRRDRALRTLFGPRIQAGPIISDLKSIASALSSTDSAVNPFHVQPPSARIQTDYAELGAKVELLAMALSDLALQLCEPGQPPLPPPRPPPPRTSTIYANPKEDPTSEEKIGQGAMSASPNLATTQNSEDQVNILLNGGEGKASSPAAVGSASRSRSTPSLRSTKAFRLAVRPYTDDRDLLRAFGLPTADSPSHTGRPSTSSSPLSPSFNRLRELHKILAALRGIYSRINEGRGLDLAMAGGSGSGSSNSGAHLSTGKGGGAAGGSTTTTTLFKTRCKDSIHRLTLALHYQCEVHTGFRVGGDAILDDDEEEEEEGEGEGEKGEDHHQRVHRKGEVQDGKRSMDMMSSSEGANGEEPSAGDPRGSSSKRQKRLGPRASDQRSLGDFFSV